MQHYLKKVEKENKISSSPAGTTRAKSRAKQGTKRKEVDSDSEEHEKPSDTEEQSQAFDQSSADEKADKEVQVQPIVVEEPKKKQKLADIPEEGDFATSQTAVKKRRISTAKLQAETVGTKRKARKSQKQVEEGKCLFILA